MKYKLISFDFDGTLLNNESIVSDETKNTILLFKEKGFIIVGVTGRNLSSSKEVVDLNMLDYLIINNGSYIYDVKNNNGHYIDSISKDSALKIINVLKSIKCQIEFITTDYYYVYKEKRNSSVPFIKDIDSIDEVDSDISRINIFFDNQDDIEVYQKLLKDNIKDINSFIMVGSDGKHKWIVVNPNFLNKLETLKILGNNLDIILDEMIFFGDSCNDLEAIEGVGCGVAMDNASDFVKQKAKYVTVSNNEDGIKFFLEKIIDNIFD